MTSQARTKSDVQQVAQVPQDLYQLLGVEPKADSAKIKQAYYDKMKICHPDVAGPEGEEMCMLLNEAYQTLSSPDSRKVHDEQCLGTGTAMTVYSTDLEPTWSWTPKASAKSKPVYTGKPYSRSLWSNVPVEDRGERWVKQDFVYVDEWSCIACRNCCDVAPRTFCIDAEAGRARVYSQWGNSEEYLDYAVMSCPVDCIHWVSREELQALEYVTRDQMYKNGSVMPCPMAAMRGNGNVTVDTFSLAQEWLERRAKEQEVLASKGLSDLAVSSNKLRQRIQEAFSNLSEVLRSAGWG